jgi:hypothetical protein
MVFKRPFIGAKGGSKMLTPWFGTRRMSHSEADRFVHPELEVLEDRLPPSSVHGNDGHHNNGGGPPAHENVHIQDNMHIQENVHNSTNITISNSFNGSTFTNALNGQNLMLMALPSSTMQGLLSSLYKQAAQINAAAANSLVANEAQLAIDTFLTFEGMPGLASNIGSLQSAIASNPLEKSSAGVLLGQVTFDVVLEGLVRSPLASAT